MIRKDALLAIAGAAAWPAFATAGNAPPTRATALRSAEKRPDSLAAAAARLGILFGSAANPAVLKGDPAYAAAVAAECSLLVPEGVLKPAYTRADPNGFDFTDADRLAVFAAAHAMSLRGHTLVWYQSIPAWVPSALIAPADVRAEFLREVTEPVRHFRGRMDSWDVVNEVINVPDAQPGGLRKSFWLEKLGPDYIAEAFVAARAADPGALLVINEYGIEADLPAHQAKRDALLGLLRALRRDNVPVGAVGIQAHLVAGAPFDPAVFDRFLAAIHDLGLQVLVTELDVTDRTVVARNATRDSIVADTIAAFLAVALRYPVTTVAAWGLSDRHSWLGGAGWGRRPDGLQPRGTLLDADLKRKAAYRAVRAAFEQARGTARDS
jgi:endo-1,4-beta-xylanase